MPPESNPSSWKVELAAGTGLGLLVGLLVGLAVTSVVGSVIAGLAALLAAFLGLSKSTDSVDRPVRIASFGFACAAALLVGISARANGWLSHRSIQQQVAEWTAAGASPADAVNYLAFERYGIVPQNRAVVTPPKAPTDTTALFASTAANNCALLSNERFATPQNRLDAMRVVGDPWATFAEKVSKAPPDQWGALTDAAYELVCGK